MCLARVNTPASLQTSLVRTISSHRLRLDCLSGWRLAENEADAAYQAANGFAKNALRALPPAAIPLGERTNDMSI